MATAFSDHPSPSKTEFVNGILESNPKANARAVNDAWAEAGYDGTVSNTLVHRLRSEKGLTGNIRRGRKKGGTNAKRKRLRPVSAEAGGLDVATAPPKRRGRPPGRARAVALAASEGVDPLEAEFDRLLFRVMERQMPDVEEAIRHARRLLFLHSAR